MLVRPTLVIVFDAVKDTITVVTPVRPEAASRRRRWRARPSAWRAVVDALDRPLDQGAADADWARW